MTRDEIKRMSRNGEAPVDILRDAVASGMEYPDAEWKVADTLRLDDEEREEMADKYLDQV